MEYTAAGQKNGSELKNNGVDGANQLLATQTYIANCAFHWSAVIPASIHLTAQTQRLVHGKNQKDLTPDQKHQLERVQMMYFEFKFHFE